MHLAQIDVHGAQSTSAVAATRMYVVIIRLKKKHRIEFGVSLPAGRLSGPCYL